MNERIVFILTLVFVLVLTGCTLSKNSEDAKKFKEEYESLNGQTNKSGKEHRSLSIDSNNPFVYATGEEIVEMIEDGETFYVYFGDKLCPWCRSVIEKAIEVANKNNIEKIYYVAIWDDEGNEILRDKYGVEDGEVVKLSDGTESYYKLLEYFDEVLSDYSLGNDLTAGEKRIYAPNFVYVEKGKAIRVTTAISDKQTDSREELTEEILKDEEEEFNKFFK